MKRALTALIFIFPAPAFACGALPEGYNFDKADYVVTGIVTCPAEGDQCEIRVKEHLKEVTISKIAPPRRFTVQEESQEARRAPFLSCVARFTPRLRGDFDGTEFSFFGEFNLRRNQDSGGFVVRGYSVRDIDGEMLASGRRCDPLPNDDGRDLKTCVSIVRRASTFSDD